MFKRGGFSSFIGSRRAMSPLIATVLLIAFAVAMGAMIMNWSASLGEAALSGPDCKGVSMVLNPVICYSQNMIKISVKNQGKDIDGVTVQIADANANNEVVLKNSALRRGDELNKDLPFIMTSQTYVGLVPAISHEGELKSCEKPALEIQELKSCQ
ncbi:hypothetical protein JW826_03210 [Candidatus Woesearchaeota archaeon]|nr:hypothetical protein [Candidatus Woesearchaeota archaeon]